VISRQTRDPGCRDSNIRRPRCTRCALGHDNTRPECTVDIGGEGVAVGSANTRRGPQYRVMWRAQQHSVWWRILRGCSMHERSVRRPAQRSCREAARSGRSRQAQVGEGYVSMAMPRTCMPVARRTERTGDCVHECVRRERLTGYSLT